jgi:hypothetical protein
MKILVRTHILNKLSLSFLVASMLLASCVQNSGVRSSKSSSKSSSTSTTTSSGGTPAIIDSSTTTTDTTLQSVKVELSHLVDPFDGTYKKKVTIPKNYKGNLYLAGLNVAALADKLVKVRFKYGTDNQAVVLDATVARAPGIIPQTDIQVLVVNMTTKPFAKMVLNYDLYDYNDYDSDTTKVPVSDPKDSGLYCRGLKLADDPSATSSAACTAATDKCLYSYAKVTDATLYDSSTYLTTIPTRPQVWSLTSGTRSPTIASSAGTMCLPDSESVDAINSMFGLTLTGFTYPTSVLGMLYKGPYRAINATGWALQGNAIFNTNKKGLFEVANSSLDPYTGYRSLMFPRSGKLSLNTGVYYMGSADRFGDQVHRAAEVTATTTTADYVDGCNLRVMNYNSATAEGINSCNVNGSIEVFYYNSSGVEVNITTDKTIKLQIIRASETDSTGKEVLTSAFKRCESSTTCGSDECCFNSRCWSKDLVTQCVDTTPVIGNEAVGASCTTDYECASLCCNSGGTCSPHITTGSTPVLCNKDPGQTCVSREFCKKEYVATCKIVKYTTSSGTASCRLSCPAVETYATCVSGLCVAPTTPAVPTFDASNPDCTNAVDP